MAEWRIGEIRQIDNEWYQCVEGNSCKECDFRNNNTSGFLCHAINVCLSRNRTDKKQVIFKKLEKVGKPFYDSNYKQVLQKYKYYTSPIISDSRVHILKLGIVRIEIKQNKEDMEEREWETEKIEQYPRGKRPKINKQEELNLKPFNLEAAKSGKPVCTRDGRKARIICFDKKCLDSQILIALVDCCEEESMYFYTTDGKCIDDFSDYDLMMLPEKRKGWINIHQYDVYKTKEEAEAKIFDKANYLTTIEIEYWR